MLAFLTTQKSPEDLSSEVRVFHTLENLLAIDTPLYGVVIDAGFTVSDVVHGLRQHNLHYLTIIRTLAGVTLTPYDKVITLPFESWEQAILDTNECVEMASLLPEYADKDLNAEVKLLNYLFVRPDRFLTPLRDLTQSQYYYYPVLKVFATKGMDERQWVTSLEQREFLQKRGLIDRVRLCPHCHSQHINFIDQCPSCTSIDIHKEELFHCFSCGNVDTRSSFQQNGQLVCRQCTTTLRHIGVDYDRTLEQYKCSSCLDIFAEPTVTTQCYECDSTTASSDLETREIYQFGLTEIAKSHTLGGTIHQVYAATNKKNLITPLHFEYSIDWALDLWTREKTLSFSLVLIDFTNVHELLEEHGSLKYTTVLTQLFQELSSKIRVVDRICHLNERQLLAFLPLTTTEGLPNAVQRLYEISLAVEPGAKLESSTYSVQADFQETDRYTSILENLRETLH